MDFREVAQAPALRVIFFSHLVPVIWATQYHWLPNSYSTYNLLFLVSLLWSLHAKDSEDAILMAAAINVFSIVFDAITIGIYYGSGQSNAFSTFMVITNLLLRPITSLVLLRFFNERSGRFSSSPLFSAFGAPFGGLVSGRSAYEDIDRTPHQSIPRPETEGPSRVVTDDQAFSPK
ncbi:Type-1 angiotensin II receptor-associated protein-like [Halotydeus destructor]|nr:Type-1 angiotensin II receptor-associated protein-like [Halotydeus destructor]